MEDDELQAIRAKRMAELQAQAAKSGVWEAQQQVLNETSDG